MTSSEEIISPALYLWVLLQALFQKIGIGCWVDADKQDEETREGMSTSIYQAVCIFILR
jgi:hypothetical protein